VVRLRTALMRKTGAVGVYSRWSKNSWDRDAFGEEREKAGPSLCSG
jgi:hypothetical protein